MTGELSENVKLRITFVRQFIRDETRTPSPELLVFVIICLLFAILCFRLYSGEI